MRSGLFVAAAAAALLGACSEPPAVDLVARGKYLVNEIAKCGDCHTPMLASGEPDASH
ncbi:MAG: cytochrome c, partial [Alphaproteobacteria bacterium]|nr:cytochrome c [Alphaproteobacteria bacterium]